MTHHTIHKYQVTPGIAGVQMPKGARILSLKVQRGQPCVWALVDPNAPLVQRHLAVYGTGFEVPAEPGRFVDTFLVDGDNFVFHLFDNGEVLRT